MGSLERRLEALERHAPAPEDDSVEVLGRLTDRERVEQSNLADMKL